MGNCSKIKCPFNALTFKNCNVNSECPYFTKRLVNAELFKQVFGIYATELWSMPEEEFLKWLNKEVIEERKEREWVSVNEAWMMEELENQIKEGKGCLGRDEE